MISISIEQYDTRQDPHPRQQSKQQKNNVFPISYSQTISVNLKKKGEKGIVIL